MVQDAEGREEMFAYIHPGFKELCVYMNQGSGMCECDVKECYLGRREVCSLESKLNIPHRVRKSQGILFPRLEHSLCQTWGSH